MGADALTRKAGVWERLTACLFTPIDGSSLAVFRMMFGALVTIEAVRHFLNGWIDRHFLEPVFHFTYYGFHWVRPLPAGLLHDFFGAMALVGVLVALGLFFRLTAFLAFLGITYLFLMEQALYLNHVYLFGLVALLLTCTNAHRAASLDRLLYRWRGPALVPAWQLYVLRAQMFLVYFFGGIAKLNGDWLRAEPVRTWLRNRSHWEGVGPFLAQEWLAWFIAYGGLIFDLGVGFLLLWKRTRLLALWLAIAFHATNNFLFNIGIFPYMAAAMTLLFLEPDWPLRLRDTLARFFSRFQSAPRPLESLDWDDEDVLSAEPTAPQATVGKPMVVPPAVVVASAPEEPFPTWRTPSPARSAWIVAAVGTYLAIQVFLPLRHWLYPGDVNWTEEGHRFSWRMKLRDKKGSFSAQVRDPATGREWQVLPTEHLKEWQIAEAAGRPDMLIQYAHFLHDQFRRQHGVREAEVYLHARARLNDHPEQVLIDPTINLAREERRLWPHSPWIVQRRL